ncbi:Uncharacterised protein [Mycobacterium tuberculosis]|nr:Uncharacterised protein [Mycobacterium tuberculosis]
MSIVKSHSFSISLGIFNSFWNNIHTSECFYFLCKGKSNRSNSTISVNQMVFFINIQRFYCFAIEDFCLLRI